MEVWTFSDTSSATAFAEELGRPSDQDFERVALVEGDGTGRAWQYYTARSVERDGMTVTTDAGPVACQSAAERAGVIPLPVYAPVVAYRRDR